MSSKRAIEIVPYNLNWPEAYSSESALLSKKLSELSFNLYHIGSTAVEGLAAKPIIDILFEIDDVQKLDDVRHRFNNIGYECLGEFGIGGRRYFQKGGNQRTHQIHAFNKGSNHIKRHIAFRDYLIVHKDIAKEYENIKVHAASLCNHDIEKYCDLKNDFVIFHEAKALIWWNKLNSH